MQPVLFVGVVFHFVMGFVLELKTMLARPVKYAVAKIVVTLLGCLEI